MQLRYIANLFKEIIGLGLEKTWTAFLHSVWFQDILDFDLKSARTTLLKLDWF